VEWELREARRSRDSRARVELIQRSVERIGDGTREDMLHFLWAESRKSGNDFAADHSDALIEKYGAEVRTAARQGWKHFWRRHETQLGHEVGDRNDLGLVELGLVGITCDFEDGLDAATLTHGEIVTMVRYATREMNGFPRWLDRLVAVDSVTVGDVLRRAIAGDYSWPEGAAPLYNVLSKLPHSSAAVRAVAVPIVRELMHQELPPRLDSLVHVVDVLAGDESSHSLLVDIAARHGVGDADDSRCALWIAVAWNFAPANGIAMWERAVEERTLTQRTELVLAVCSRIGRWGGDIRRQVRQWPADLDVLVRTARLLLAHVSASDGEGNGLTGPLEEAEHLRDGVIGRIADTPDPRASAALRDLAEDRRWPNRRPEFLFLAERADETNASQAASQAADKVMRVFARYGLEGMEHLADEELTNPVLSSERFEMLQKIMAAACGVGIVCALLYVAIRQGATIDDRQFAILRMVGAVGLAGLAGLIPGFLEVKLEHGKWVVIRATGAIAVFVIVYF
jgi:hypothetical protein